MLEGCVQCAALSNAVVQLTSMLVQPFRMLAQLRIWIGCGSDLVFDRHLETSSTARFIKDAGHLETRVKKFQTRVKPGLQTRVKNFLTLV